MNPEDAFIASGDDARTLYQGYLKLTGESDKPHITDSLVLGGHQIDASSVVEAWRVGAFDRVKIDDALHSNVMVHQDADKWQKELYQDLTNRQQ
jgi:hypothetical protein